MSIGQLSLKTDFFRSITANATMQQSAVTSTLAVESRNARNDLPTAKF